MQSGSMKDANRAGVRGMRSGCYKRGSGDAENRLKALGLGVALLVFFVDVAQHLKCRTDSLMLMQEARRMRE